MTEPKERRADYLKLSEITTELATMNANIQNVIKMFETHLADDKETVKRVNTLSDKISLINGKILGASGASAVFGSIFGALITMFVKGVK